MTTARQTWDAIVVGGGPAGSTAARRLALGGARTLLLEKAEHPRYKVCGGGIPVRTAALLDFSIEPVVEGTAQAVEISHKGTRATRMESVKPLAYMVMRDQFDALLLEYAEAAGATVHSGDAVQNVETRDGWAQVTTEHDQYQGRYVIGADGATGQTARASGLAQGMAQSAAWELEVDAPAAALRRWDGVVNVDVGYRPWGYGWVFPKHGRLSVGVVAAPGQGRNVRKWGTAYLKRLGLEDATIAIAKGHPIRYRRGEEPIARGPVLLTGDAAGLADELTAEGIGYAVQSGQLASEAVLQAMATDGDAASVYECAVNGSIQSELDAARLIGKAYYRGMTMWPWMALHLIKRADYFWGAFFRVMRGESRYDLELERVPGLAKVLRFI